MGEGSSSAPASPTYSLRGLSFWLSPSELGPSSEDIVIEWLAPSELTGALSSAVDVSFSSGSGLGAGEAFPTGSVESLGSSSTSIFSAISCLPLGCYSSRCSGRYDLPGTCWPFYRLQPSPSCVLIGASWSRDRVGWLASGWLAQEGGVQPPGGGGGTFPRCISGNWVFPVC